MKKHLIILLLIIPSIIYSYNHVFDEGNQEYSNENYNEALQIYFSIKDSNNAILYYNIANCYYKLNDFPSAILYYEKSLKLDNTLTDTKYNLEIANLRIIDRIEKLPELFYIKWWNYICNIFTIKTWQIFSIILIWLFLILKITERYYMYLRIWSKIIFILSLITLLITVDVYKKSKERYAILFSSIETVRSAPSEKSTNLFNIHSGTKIEIVDQIGNWINIKIDNGNTGWINLLSCKEI